MIAIILFLLLVLSFQSALSGDPVLIQNSVDCYSCMNRDYSKACYSTSGSSSLYCCDENDFSLNCGGGTGGFCNDDEDTSKFPEDSQYTMCPYDRPCGSQFFYVYSNNGMTVSTDYVPQGGVCWFSIQKMVGSYEGLEFKNIISKNVSISLYSYQDRNKFSYIGDLTDETYQISSRDKKTVYVVVVSDGTRIGNLQFDIALYGSELSTGEIIGIIAGCVGFVVIIIIFIILCIRCCKKRAAARKARLNNQYQKLEPPRNINYQPNLINQHNTQMPQTNNPQTSQITKEKEALIEEGIYPANINQTSKNPSNPKDRKLNKEDPAYPTLDGLD